MLRMKNILPVFVVLLFLGVASTAFAQISCNVASTPVSRDSNTGVTEPAGDITFQCQQTGATASTAGATITVNYQSIPITNDTTFPTGANYNNGGALLGPSKPISVTTTGGAGCNPPTGVAVSNSTGQVVVTMGSVGPGVGLTCSYTLTGVLLAISGSGATSVIATVSVSPGNNLLITAGQNTPTVVTSVLAPIVAAGVTVTAGPGIVPTTGSSAAFNAAFSIATTENYIDMFRDISTFNGGAASNSVQLLYTFTGIPTGASLTGCSATSTTPVAGVATLDGTTTISSATVTSAAPTLTVGYAVGAGPSLSAIDTITLSCTGFANGTATLPLTAGSITATVSLAPVGTAFNATGGVLNNNTAGVTTGKIPRYTGPQFGPFTVVNLIPLTTHMLFPYVAVGNGFDTGLVIANTTADPYGAGAKGATVLAGAQALAGPVTIAFYPAGGGTPFCVSTGAGAATVNGIASCTTVTAGTGLTSGSVSSGSSYVVLASQLFAAVSGAPTSFTGYAFAIANFPFAHPTGFVADAAFSGKFASGGPALVLTNPSVLGRAGTTTPGWAGGLTESLGH